MDLSKANLIGAFIALVILLSASLIFLFRLTHHQAAEYWTGIVFMVTAIPIVYLLSISVEFERPSLYYIQLVLMLGFIIVELFLDYILKIEFRQVKWMAISYAMLFFASTGGMIGIASNAGKAWMICTVILFFVMAVLAFIQRAKTGM